VDAGLTDLPPPILHTVFSCLYSDIRATFCALGSVYRICRAASGMFLFREITLRGVRDVEAVSLRRVRMHGETVGANVRCVRVAWSSGGLCMRTMRELYVDRSIVLWMLDWTTPDVQGHNKLPVRNETSRSWIGRLTQIS
jgi:hypothetical protein